QYKLLILDSQTFRFVGSLLSQNEILDLDVMRTELLESQRLPDQLTEAIYIIEPNSDNIARLIADCTRSSASSAVHVFFTGELDDSLFNQLKASPAINMFRTLKELFMDFYGFEAGTFLTVPPVVPQRMHNSLISGGNSFHRLFSPMSERFCNSHLEVVAKRIMAACSGIGVTQPPVIRYWRNNEEENTIAKRLAMYVQVEFDKLSPPESGSSSKSTGSRTEMLVVDRTIDQYAPLLHEFTYQAMAMDLVGKSISVCGADGPNYGKLMYTYVAETGQGNLTKDFYLDDSADSLWAKYRHSHIVNAQEEIVAQFRQVMAEGQSLEEIGNTQSGNKPSVAALRDAVYSLPEYQEKKAVYSAHIKLLSECMDAFRQRQMPKVAEVEQDMVMGVSSDGIKIESIENTLIPLLGSLGSSSEQLSDKLRLLLLYAINKAGDIRDVDRRRLIQLAKL
ncbi:Sec1-like protein, partial [Ramicandelaber brevisporus]